MDSPSGVDLLEAVRRTLTDRLAPRLAGEERYLAMLAASAVGMVARELVLSGALAAAGARLGHPEALALAIRAGAHDGDPMLHAALLEVATIAAQISRPTAEQR